MAQVVVSYALQIVGEMKADKVLNIEYVYNHLTIIVQDALIKGRWRTIKIRTIHSNKTFL